MGGACRRRALRPGRRRRWSPTVPLRRSPYPPGWTGDPRPVGAHRDRRAFRSRCAAATKSPAAKPFWARHVAERLGLGAGDRVTVGGQSLVVGVEGQRSIGHVSRCPLAQSVVGDNGWWTVFAPPGDEKRRDLAQIFGAAVGLRSTPDPSVNAGSRRSRPDLRHRRRLRPADVRAEVLGAVLRQGHQLDAWPDLDHRLGPRIRHRGVVVPRGGGRAAPRIRHHVQHRPGRRGAVLLPRRIGDRVPRRLPASAYSARESLSRL